MISVEDPIHQLTAMNDKPEQLRLEHMNGMTYKAIAEKYYIDQRTAKRYVLNNLPISELEHRGFASILDPYKPIIDEWIQSGQRKYKTLYEDLKSLGYTGSYHLMYRYARKQTDELAVQLKCEEHLQANITTTSGAKIPTIPDINSRIEKEKKYATDHFGRKQ